MRRRAANRGSLVAIILLLVSCTATPLVPSNELAGDGLALLTGRTMVRLELSPDTARIALDGSQQVSVKATYSDSSTVTDPSSFAWTALGGWISNGMYSSKGLPGTYKLTVRVVGGPSDSSIVIIGGVTPPPPPPATPTLTLASLKPAIAVGDSAILTWTSTNATACTASVGWTGSKALTGSAVVKPAATTTYTLTCTGAAGSIAQSVTETVTAVPPVAVPTLTFSSLKPIIVAGDSTTLTWTSGNATGCTASAGWVGNKALSGTTVAKPTVSTTYTLTCTGAGGSIAKSVTETVSPVPPVAVPTLNFSSLKAAILAGDSATLSWSSTSATSCTASAGWTGSKTLTGTAVVTPTVTTTYTLACVGAGGSTSQSVTETVTPVAPPPPVDGTLPHQPAGLSTLVNEGWSQVTPSGWAGPCGGGCASHVGVTQDAAAPRSPSSVLTFTYLGNIGGQGVGQIVKAWPGVKTIYMALWFKHSANWVGHNSGVNKMLYLGTNQGIGNQNENILNYETDQSVSLFEQNGIDDHGRMGVGFSVLKGQWHFVELVATASTGGQLNGCLTIWVDGRQGVNRCDIRWKVGADAMFTGVDVDPIFGGGAQTVNPAQYFYIDHLYMSGK